MPIGHVSASVVAVALACVLSACDSSSPTEPQARHVSFTFTASPTGGGPPGTLTLATDTCSCFASALTVSIDGSQVGVLSCSEEKRFLVASTRFQLSLSSPDMAAQVTFTVDYTDAKSGPSLVVRCPLR